MKLFPLHRWLMSNDDLVRLKHNHLIHAYFDVDLDLVWKTFTHDLPFLITEIEKIIPSKTDA